MIAVLARHDIINVLSSPTIMFPLCLIGVVVGYAYKNGHLEKAQVLIDVGKSVLDVGGGSSGRNEATPTPTPAQS